MSRKFAHLYTTTKTRYNYKKQKWEMLRGEDGTLFSMSIYPTKIKAEDLPEWYVWGRYYKEFGYMSAAGVRHMVYVPSKFTNHMFKDDFLYISYRGMIAVNTDREKWWERYTVYDEYIYGGDIVNFLKAAEKYSSYDITEIKKQIEEKRLWFKETYPESYELEVPHDSPFFADTILMKKESEEDHVFCRERE